MHFIFVIQTHNLMVHISNTNEMNTYTYTSFFFQSYSAFSRMIVLMRNDWKICSNKRLLKKLGGGGYKVDMQMRFLAFHNFYLSGGRVSIFHQRIYVCIKFLGVHGKMSFI